MTLATRIVGAVLILVVVLSIIVYVLSQTLTTGD
jgi:hypothetical protein